MFNTFLNPGNKTSLTGILDIVANSVSLIVTDENNDDEPISIQDLYVNKNKIASSTQGFIPIGFGQHVSQYEFNGEIDDTYVPGLESILDYIHTNHYNKLDPAITNNIFNVSKHLHNIYNDNYITNKIDKRKTINNYDHNINENHTLQKKVFTTNNITNNISNQINNYVEDTNININKDYSTRNYVNNNSTCYNHLYNNEYTLNKKYDNRVVNNYNTVNKSIHTIDNNYTNLFKTVKNNTKKSYNFIFNEDTVTHKTNNITNNNSNIIFKDQHINYISDEYIFNKKSYTTNQITNNVKKYDVSNHDINIVKKKKR